MCSYSLFLRDDQFGLFDKLGFAKQMHRKIRGYLDPCIRPVGNAFMHSETRRFVPVSTLPNVCRFYLLLTGEVPRRGGGREKSGSFCQKIFSFSGLSILARRSRLHAKHSKSRPISPSAAPPQLPRQEELSPDRAAERAGAGTFCRPLLPGQAWPVLYRVCAAVGVHLT